MCSNEVAKMSSEVPCYDEYQIVSFIVMMIVGLYRPKFGCIERVCFVQILILIHFAIG